MNWSRRKRINYYTKPIIVRMVWNKQFNRNQLITFSNSRFRWISASLGPAREMGFENPTCWVGGGGGGVEPPLGLPEPAIFDLEDSDREILSLHLSNGWHEIAAVQRCPRMEDLDRDLDLDLGFGWVEVRWRSVFFIGNSKELRERLGINMIHDVM